MRLRSFTGRTMNEAMAEVRTHLGPDAVIVSTEEEDGEVRVTAALEEDLPPGALDRRAAPPAAAQDAIDVIADALSTHGLPPDPLEKIVAAALPFDAEEPLVALSSALATIYPFTPITAESDSRVFLLAGPPGAGKSVTAAKLAARAVLNGGKASLISADAARAGASDQLAAFARILDVPLTRVADEAALVDAVAAADPKRLVIIDTAGVNPFDAEDRRELRGLIAASEAEPVLVLPSGGDVLDTVEMAQVFAELGCARIVATRLDIARRIGSLVAAADTARLGFAEAGISPSIADGLNSLNPVLLARLLLSQKARAKRPMLAHTR